VIRALERLGFVQVRQRGSHVIMKKETLAGPIGCVVPRHKVVAIGTVKSILRQAQVPTEEFLAVLK
jgi:predicted RNA binding protein YcfA (HicA-like mRNA interferase family)